MTEVFSDAIDSLGIPYEGIGIGYGDGVIDNERYGMRKFLYYNWNFGINGRPTLASHYYNYMQGFWKNGQRMAYSGDGLSAGSGANLEIAADYMFPGDTDPINGERSGLKLTIGPKFCQQPRETDCSFKARAPSPWSLRTTTASQWGWFGQGPRRDPFESVQLLRIADDKAQACSTTALKSCQARMLRM